MYSCDFNNDPIPVSNLDQDNLEYKKFTLSTSLSDTIKRTNQFGSSSLLYSGSINDSDYVYSIFEFNKDIFENYDLCNKDSLSFKELYLVLDVVNEYSPDSSNDINENSNNFNDNISIDVPPFFAYWLNYEDLKDGQGNNILHDQWSEEDLYEFTNLDLSDYFNIYNSDNSKRLFVEHHLGKYYIDLADKMINFSNECQTILDESSCNDNCIWDKDVCKSLNTIDLCSMNDIGNSFILLSTNPNFDKLYEIASSEYTSDYSNTEPYVNLVYDEYEELNKTSNKFIINNILPMVGSALYIKDTLKNDYNRMFLGNFLDNNLNEIVSSEIQDSIEWSNVDCEEDLDFCIESYNFSDSVSEEQERILLNIEVDLVNIQNFADSGIKFWLDNIKYLENKTDPNSDNWYDLNDNQLWDENEGTENNQLYDQGEFYLDYGSDQCPDIYENGLGGCLCVYPYDDCDESLVIYNLDGTENNNQHDIGETFDDYGSDGCLDEQERGAVLNADGSINAELSWTCGACEINDINENCNEDPNNDNYNIDPSEDNWIDLDYDNKWDSNEGTESNNIWNEGELFLDFGLDGLSENDIGFKDSDGTEANGIYDFYDINGDGVQQSNELGEPFFDFGADGIKNSDEPGYNPTGTQGNNEWNFNESFDDCGIDNDCNDDNISDNWNIDPNVDFWLDCGSDHICPEDDDYIEPDTNGTERNNLWDNSFCQDSNFSEQNDCENNGFIWYEAEFSEGNSVWNQGEFFQDFGIDQKSDDQELFVIEQKVNVTNTDTTLYNYLTQSVDFYPEFINQEQDSVKVWISSISQINNEAKLDIEISFLNDIDLLGLEFKLEHEIYSNTVNDWNQKTRNIAKINNISYIKDASLYNSIYQSNNSLYMNQAYGISSKLNFDQLDIFLEEAMQNGYIISESNSNMKLHLNKSDQFKLESNSYIINFNELDSSSSDLIFSYFVSNNPDSIIVPIGNLLQNYVNGIYNYNNGIELSLETNLYPPLYNFNNILIDTLNSPSIKLYYYK
tara:strand:- start:4735 stop:7785 length:3051 start_codon:yes stop_codon:yes gene_type:complete